MCITCAIALLASLPAVAHASDLSPSSFDPGPAQYPNVARQSDVPITMRDGVKLYADVYRPADAEGKPVPGRFPVVLVESIFNKDNAPVMDAPPTESTRVGDIGTQATGYASLFVEHGYVEVIVSVRGTGTSEGDWSVFGSQEKDDAYDVARWLVREPFSDGRFVGYGFSCGAAEQLYLGGGRPPGLKALFPILPFDDFYRDLVWHGGGFDADFFPLWVGLVTANKLLPPHYVTSDPGGAVQVTASRAYPGMNLSARMLMAGPFSSELAYDNEFWHERSPGRVAGRIDVPTFVVGGWEDLLVRGEPRIYDELQLPPGQKQLLMGDWYHLTVGQGLGQPGAPPPLQVLALAWFDHWVKGKQNGIESYGPVTVHQLDSNRWETYRQYPRHDVQYERFYLSGGKSGSAQSLNDGQLTMAAPAAAGSDAMPGNNVNGVCTRSSVQWTFTVIPPGQPCETDNRSAEATALTYSTPPLDSPLHLSGPLSLTLNGSTTAHDSTWIATVSDVAPDGKSTQITAGWLIQSRRALDDSRTTFAPNGDPVVPFHPFTQDTVLPVKPGEKESMAIEIFNTDAVLPPGHRLRVTVSSGDVPHILAPSDSAVESAGGISTVFRGGSSQSFLTAAVAPLGPE
ncbi:MAG: CocE/NonD family hydrolase [Gaiellaceae bacterium]